MPRPVTIHKYALTITDQQTIPVAGYCELLDIQMQGRSMVLWCAVLKGSVELMPLRVRIFGTGHVIPDDVSLRTYRRTVQDGDFVWHVFVREGGA